MLFYFVMSVMNLAAADQTRMMQDQMSGAPMGMQQDMSKAFTVV